MVAYRSEQSAVVLQQPVHARPTGGSTCRIACLRVIGEIRDGHLDGDGVDIEAAENMSLPKEY
ncbi:MAG: hypothetical protein MZW92_26865 [Comamonadaceae bacterium]|nr:hypothetical protein [Comamonadaceae bacterium]